jgi:hypothetical protein
LGVDIQEFNEDQGGEGDGDDVGVGVVEEDDGEHYYHGALEY